MTELLYFILLMAALYWFGDKLTKRHGPENRYDINGE